MNRITNKIAIAAGVAGLAVGLFGNLDTVGAAVGIERAPSSAPNYIKSYWVDPDGEVVNTYKTTAAGEATTRDILQSLLDVSYSNESLGNGGVIVVQYTDGPSGFHVGANKTASIY